MESSIIDVFLHLDLHLAEWLGMLGPWIYLLLFLVIFCETGCFDGLDSCAGMISDSSMNAGCAGAAAGSTAHDAMAWTCYR